MDKKSIKKAVALGGALFSAVVALSLTACFNPPAGLGDHLTHSTGDGSLVNVKIGIGRGGSSARSLSPELAESYFNYMEVIFVNTNDAGTPGEVDNTSDFYRVTGFVNQSVNLKIPTGNYDNTEGKNKAIMLAGVRNLLSGECTLLATGVIVANKRKDSNIELEYAGAEITKDTTSIIFELTALEAGISDSTESAFQITPTHNHGITKIEGVKHVYFGIEAADTEGVAKDTTATLTLTGWGDDTRPISEGGKGENNTQQFIHLVHQTESTFVLPGIGSFTAEGDKPLASTTDVTWKLTNTPGAMTRDNDNASINITFTSKSTSEYSGMGWLSVRAPVRAFAAAAKANTQVWQVGSGILQNRLNTGADSAGAGIVILHGRKIFQPGLGVTQQIFDLFLNNPIPPYTWNEWDSTATDNERVKWRPISELVDNLSDPEIRRRTEALSRDGMWICKVERDIKNSSQDSAYDQIVYTLLGEPDKVVRISHTAGSTKLNTIQKPREVDARRFEVEEGANVQVILNNAKIYLAEDNNVMLRSPPSW